MRATVLAAALVLVSGCDSSPTLSVRVQSGLRAGLDLTRIDVSVHRGAVPCPPVGASVGGGGANLVPGDDLAAGLPVVDLVLAPDTYTIHATGQVADRIVRRCLVVTLASSRVVRVPLSVSCLDVQCPAPTGSAAFNECLNGRCVDPRCDPDDPSTAELCCDRALLGEACDDDPTLCRASTDCEATLACAGTPACAQGVCVEPVDDQCAEGTFCSATSSTCEPLPGAIEDAGAIDAFVSIDGASERVDAFVPIDAYEDDAYVPPGIDAPFPDAFMPDAFIEDAFVADAPFVPDAFAPDAGTDAYEPPSGPEGSCSDGLDGDADRAIDCEDTDCSAHADCVGLPCLVGTVMLDAAAEGLPTAPSGPILWWRDDTNLGTRAFGVCGWGDGIRGLVLRPSSRSRAPLLTAAPGGGSAVGMAPGDFLTAFDASAMTPSAARTIIVIAHQASDGFNHAFVTGATNRPDVVTGLRHDTTTYAYEGSTRVAPASGMFAPGFVGEILTMPVGHAPSTAALFIDGTSRMLTDRGEAAVLHTPDRHSLGSPSSVGTLEVLEIIVYDRELDATDRALVDAYVVSRLSVGS